MKEKTYVLSRQIAPKTVLVGEIAGKCISFSALVKIREMKIRKCNISINATAFCASAIKLLTLTQSFSLAIND